MAEPDQAPEPARLPVQGYPDRNFPVVFADGVLAAAIGAGVVKYYLMRVDPSFAGNGTSSIVPFAEVVMPTEGFAATAAFFEANVHTLISLGALTNEKYEEFKQNFRQATND